MGLLLTACVSCGGLFVHRLRSDPVPFEGQWAWYLYIAGEPGEERVVHREDWDADPHTALVVVRNNSLEKDLMRQNRYRRWLEPWRDRLCVQERIELLVRLESADPRNPVRSGVSVQSILARNSAAEIERMTELPAEVRGWVIDGRTRIERIAPSFVRIAWPLVGAVLAFVGVLAMLPITLLRVRARRRLAAGLCPRCRYGLSDAHECMECGVRFVARGG